MSERKTRLLIVDDESQIRDTIADFFRKRGFDVEEAADGEEGLHKLQESVFDVAIVDIRMPRMDGVQLAERVAAEGIDTSIVILTGHGDKEDAVRAINAGVVEGWFEKPTMQLPEILQKVEELAEVMPLDEIRRILSTLPDEQGRSA